MSSIKRRLAKLEERSEPYFTLTLRDGSKYRALRSDLDRLTHTAMEEPDSPQGIAFRQATRADSSAAFHLAFFRQHLHARESVG